jgi:hypothetical protein
MEKEKITNAFVNCLGRVLNFFIQINNFTKKTTKRRVSSCKATELVFHNIKN